MVRSVRARIGASSVLALLALFLAPVQAASGAAVVETPESAASPEPVSSPVVPGPDGSVVVGEEGVEPGARGEVLGEQWQDSGDEAHVVLNDAQGVTVVSAQAADGYRWEPVASLPVPWADTDLWVSNSCVTSSGDFMAVVYAPRAASNDEASFSGGASAAVVDLRSGAVTDLGSGYTIAYYNPGCGAGDTVTITRLEPESGLTRVAVVDAASGEVTRTADVAGQVTSAVSRSDGTVVAARGGEVIAVAPDAAAGAEPQVVLSAPGGAYDLTLDEQERLAYVTRDAKGETATAYVATLGEEPAAQAVGSGPVTQVGVEPAREGGFFLTGQKVKKRGKGVPGVTALPQAGPGSVISSQGDLVVEQVAPAGLAKPPKAGDAKRSVQDTTTEAQIAATAVQSGTALTFDMGAAVQAAAPAQVSVSASVLASTATDGNAATTWNTGGDQHDPVEDERWCAVPRNDPKNQAYQPKPRQVEWAVDRAVKGQLTETRPANWRNLGMGSYSPQKLFPPRTLIGGGTIPPQVVLGVLAQESNLWQASRYTAPGNTGNPLIGDFYGTRDTGSIWKIDYTGADCGYGIGQITDGMRLPGFERTEGGRKIETALPYEQQRAIALDYTANIAKAVQMLGDKWNELAKAGILANGGDPKYIENWFMVTWAYNSGFHPYVDANTPWGLGWFNNPINPNYSPSRLPFMEIQADASHPQDWPYPEKINGWAAYGTSLVETQSANPETRQYDSRFVSSYTTAWWNDAAYRTSAQPRRVLFCDPDVNDCNPHDSAQPCQLSTSTTNYFQCWWHAPVQWKNNCKEQCGQGFERFPASYATEASSMLSTLPAKTRESSFLPNCTQVPDGVVVVDNTTQPSARNSGECSRWDTAGSFQFTFGTPDAAGRYPSKVDLHQQGGGFNAHFYFAHMQHGARTTSHVTGTWDRGEDMTGTWTRVWVHLPSYAAFTQQAGYTIDLGDGTTQTRYLPQRRYANEWVSLGVFQMKGSPKVSLSNVLIDESTRRPIDDSNPKATLEEKMVDIDGYDNVAWDAVGFQPLPGKPTDFVVALGDSYASGEGAGDFEPWSDNNGTVLKSRNNCHQSRNAWIRKTTLPGRSSSIGARADAANTNLDFHFLACSGAESEHLLPFYTVNGGDKPHNGHKDANGQYDQDGRYGQHGMVSQLDAGYLDENTTLVTLSIGGNDMKFGPIVAGCVLVFFNPLSPNGDCSSLVVHGDTDEIVTASRSRLTGELRESLATTLRTIRERAPHARIAITGYPKLFESDTLCVMVARPNQTWLNELADNLNIVIEDVATSAARPGEPEIVYVDTQAKFTGRNLCTENSGINGLQLDVTPGENPLIPGSRTLVKGDVASQTSVHPNTAGTDLYTAALEEALAPYYP